MSAEFSTVSSIQHLLNFQKMSFFVIFILFSSVAANLEGPFLFWGPKSLERYKRPALSFLEQDDLTKIYSGQSAIVVFNNQDSVSLSSGYFPRLRKMLEGQSSLVLPQDFLDVHPDYVSNETTVSGILIKTLKSYVNLPKFILILSVFILANLIAMHLITVLKFVLC